ncbi:MAG: hypothetical protein Q4Q20_04835 [Methanocorpusculum sp.]|nr:hypothetical protein [Methanocorpusculum sp.]
MDEPAKTEARNYLSAAGFFVIAAYSLLFAFGNINDTIQLASGIGLLLVGTLLIVLRKRDMIAILFMLIAFYFVSLGFIPGFSGLVIPLCFCGLIVLTLLVTLTGKDKAKWLLIIIPLLMVIVSLVHLLSGTTVTLLLWLPAIAALYFALACASERISLPGRKLLTADEETDFKAAGSVFGYLLFAFTMALWALYNLAGTAAGLSLETMQTVELVCAVLMVVVSILLFAVGKMRFTPVMFLLMGVTTILGIYSTGTMVIGLGILFLVIGLFAILRKETRILPGIMLILLSIVYFILGGAGYGVPVTAIGIIEIVVAAISVYLAFVVYSQKKLPKF